MTILVSWAYLRFFGFAILAHLSIFQSHHHDGNGDRRAFSGNGHLPDYATEQPLFRPAQTFATTGLKTIEGLSK
jgi:hypothetical protein